MKCNNCGAPLEADDKFCQICGIPVDSPEPETDIQSDAPSAAPSLVCSKCGAELAADDRFCQMCGHPADSDEPEQESPSDAPSAAPSLVCSKCGAELAPDDNFCQMCGTPTGAAVQPEAETPASPTQETLGTSSASTQEDLQPPRQTKKINSKRILLILLVSVLAVCLLFVFRGHRQRDLISEKADPDSKGHQTVSVSVPENELSSESQVETEIPYHSQIIRVNTQGDKATLTLDIFDEDSLSWKHVLDAKAYIGKNGATAKKKEGDKCTPAGTFDLLFVFGTSKPDTSLTFKKVDKNTVWIDDTKSAYYNTWQNEKASHKDWQNSKPIIRKFEQKLVTYRIAFSFNGDCLSKNSAKSGRGSGLFLEGIGSKGKLTSGYGDIRISGKDMKKLLRYLDSSKHPQIEIN